MSYERPFLLARIGPPGSGTLRIDNASTRRLSLSTQAFTAHFNLSGVSIATVKTGDGEITLVLHESFLDLKWPHRLGSPLRCLRSQALALLCESQLFSREQSPPKSGCRIPALVSPLKKRWSASRGISAMRTGRGSLPSYFRGIIGSASELPAGRCATTLPIARATLLDPCGVKFALSLLDLTLTRFGR